MAERIIDETSFTLLRKDLAGLVTLLELLTLIVYPVHVNFLKFVTVYSNLSFNRKKLL